jgi:peptidoglycan hydrolase-like protein with peptidoglycan-binding domain
MPSGQKQDFAFQAATLSTSSPPGDEIYKLQTLLAKYGYLADYRPGVYDEATSIAVAQFQSFYRIYPEDDGLADPATLDLLSQVRCGVADLTLIDRDPGAPLAPFVTIGAKWQKKDLAYRFLNTTPDLPVQRQQDIIREAFQRWQKVCGLKFQEKPANATTELSIAFHHGSHGDGNPFDDGGGPDGNTLAHAFFPPPRGGAWAGALHFDEFELWKDQPGGAGIRLYNVTLHEIGHLLGLAHSQDTSAIMYAYYAEDRNDLRPDDIAGAQSLYGAPEAQPASITPGEQISGYMPSTGAEVSYQLTVQNKLLVRLSGPPDQDFDVYVRHGAPVERNQERYDEVSYGMTSEELVTINAPKPGTYYILVHSYRGSGSYTLQARVT